MSVSIRNVTSSCIGHHRNDGNGGEFFLRLRWFHDLILSSRQQFLMSVSKNATIGRSSQKIHGKQMRFRYVFDLVCRSMHA